MLRVALAAGGTAGHVFPAVAVADALEATGLAIETHFLGTPAGLEHQLLRRLEREVVLLPGLPFQCRGPVARLQSLLAIAPAVVEARRFLRDAHIDLVVGFGGYASIGPLLAGRTLGIRTALVDGNARLGLANRRLAPFVDRCCTSAIPVRREIAAIAGPASLPPRERVSVVVFGDAFLDARVPALLRANATHVVHRSKDTDPHLIRRAYGDDVQVEVVRHVEDVAALYQRAHFVVARGGASTLGELAISGLPSLIVPLRGAAENHQLDNALPYRAARAAIVEEETSWNDIALRETITRVLTQPAEWLRMSRAVRTFAKPDAAHVIAHDLVTLCAKNAPAFELPTVTDLEGAA